MLTTPHRKNWPCYGTDTGSSGLDWSFGTTQALEKGNEFWYMECKKPL